MKATAHPASKWSTTLNVSAIMRRNMVRNKIAQCGAAFTCKKKQGRKAFCRGKYTEL